MMSHFSVLVIGEEIERQLAPYAENIEVERYKVRETPEDFQRFIDFYSNPTPEKDYEIKGIEAAKAAGFYPVTQATARGAWAALTEDWNGGTGGWDADGPFNWSTYNPKSRWDYWRIGGRWGGYWRLKPGKTGHTDPIAWELTFNDSTRRIPADRCDQAMKGDIDFEAMEVEEAAKAAEDWAVWEPILTDLPMAKPWSEFCARVEAGVLSIDQARLDYRAQPQVQAVDRAFKDRWSVSPSDFGSDREEYIADRAQRIWVPFAFVLDGEWHEKGHMGWFGVSSDKPEEQKPWTVETRSVVLNLPDETLLTIVDCHI